MLPKLNEITRVSQLFTVKLLIALEVLDWDFDGNGMVIRDGAELQMAIVQRFPELTDDMVFERDEE